MGAALLFVLEQVAVKGQRYQDASVEKIERTTEDGVRAAMDLARSLPFGRLAEYAVAAADEVGSHWGPNWTLPVVRDRLLRRPIAQTLADRPDAGRWTEALSTEQ